MSHGVDAAETAPERDTEQRMDPSRFFDLSLDLLCIAEMDGTFVRLNPAWTISLGYSAEELSGLSLLTIVHPNDREATVDELQQLSRGIPTVEFETRVRCSDGTFRWFSWSATPEDAEGMIYAVGRDLTQRRRMEAALRQSAHRLRSFVEHAPAAIAMFDRDMRYLSYSRRWLRDYKLEGGDLIGKSHYDVFPEVPQRLKDIHARCLQGDIEHCEEDPFPLANGNIEWVRWEIRPWRNYRQEIGGIVMFTELITERKRAEVQRRKLESRMNAAQKLESLGVLAGRISHEFNNLLVGIVGNAGLALSKLPPASDTWRHVERIEQIAKRASELTNQLLAYSGQRQAPHEPRDLSRLVKDSLGILEMAVSKRAKLSFQLANDLPIVSADASQLRQVVLNLVTNASDAIGDRDGTITVQTRAVRVEDLPTDGREKVSSDSGLLVELEVSDDGPGMDAELRNQIFEPFFTTKESGRGLGLSSSLGIVRAHGGVIHVDTEPGAGAKFRVLLPATGPAQPEPEAEPEDEGSAPVASATGTVLVVDDEEAVRAVAEAALEAGGFSVLLAEDGEQAVKLYREHTDDVVAVLLDMSMPGMSGPEILVELRSIREDVCIVLSSGYGEGETREKFGDEQTAGFLQKPYHVQALIDAVHRTVAKHVARAGSDE